MATYTMPSEAEDLAQHLHLVLLSGFVRAGESRLDERAEPLL